ncbi:MAG: hypothetical protein K2K75_02530 [Muribaculaceae bacterium]|nr:hypothetical protein [Muribaculaceae bacterium]
MTNRRGFIKGCAGLACVCWFGSVFDFTAKGSEVDKKPEINRDEAFALQWITELLDSLDQNNLSEAQLRSIVKSTSQAHHDLLAVPEMVKPYIGKPTEFIEFLQNAWGWIVKDDTTSRMLIVDENKPMCVCPLLKNNSDKLFPALCYCSEGFAEKMFSYVYQHPVEVTVAASVQRGDPSCIYHVKY